MIGRVLAIALLALAAVCDANDSSQREGGSDNNTSFGLSPPASDKPVAVRFDFELQDVNSIDSVSETFEFTGIMTLTWRDPRESFVPSVEGVSEKVFQGDYQFDEVATGWYPQIILLNQSGDYTRSGVQLRIRADGTTVLTEKITAVAESALDMRTFPFDAHRLEASFAVLGHTSDEVILSVSTKRNEDSPIKIPGWLLERISLQEAEDPGGGSPTWNNSTVLGIEVAREATYIRRLITFPMAVIVLLSFSIFWMEKSSLADRNSISFIGVLTNVAFQQSVVSVIPPVSYITLLTGFLFISFLIMGATIPINILVAECDKRGKYALGDQIDRHCRWLFPMAYLGLILLLTLGAFEVSFSRLVSGVATTT